MSTIEGRTRMPNAPHKIAAAVVMSLTALMVLAGCTATPVAKVTPTPSVKTSTPPATGTVHGQLTVTAPGHIHEFNGTSCSVNDDSGYGDLNENAEVDAVDASGKVLAFSALETGEASNSGDDCFFPFTITDVPKGEKLYGLQIGRRGITHYSEKDFFEKLFPTIGD